MKRIVLSFSTLGMKKNYSIIMYDVINKNGISARFDSFRKFIHKLGTERYYNLLSSFPPHYEQQIIFKYVSLHPYLLQLIPYINKHLYKFEYYDGVKCFDIYPHEMIEYLRDIEITQNVPIVEQTEIPIIHYSELFSDSETRKIVQTENNSDGEIV